MASASAKLYTPRMLALSAGLSHYPYAEPFDSRAEARSSTCGSTINLGVNVDGGGGVARLGLMVSACAVGQSSAAILANGAKGHSLEDFDAVLAGLEFWLKSKGNMPDWPELDVLETVREFTGRHGALLLPWRAMVKALSTAQLSSGARSS